MTAKEGAVIVSDLTFAHCILSLSTCGSTAPPRVLPPRVAEHLQLCSYLLSPRAAEHL